VRQTAYIPVHVIPLSTPAPVRWGNTRDLTNFSAKFSSTGAKKLIENNYVPTLQEGDLIYQFLLSELLPSKPQMWDRCRCQIPTRGITRGIKLHPRA